MKKLIIAVVFGLLSKSCSNEIVEYKEIISKEVFSEPTLLEDTVWLSKVDSIMNKDKVRARESIAWRHKNPGNIVSFTETKYRKGGDYRKFPCIKDGLKAMKLQLYFYITGESLHSDSTTTLKEHCCYYANPRSFYLKFMCGKLKVDSTTRINTLNIDTLMKYHIMIEDVKLYKLLYYGRTKKEIPKTTI